MNEARRQQRETLDAEPIRPGRTLRCPHPGKLVYPTKAKAKKALSRQSSGGSTSRSLLHPYRCECGSWHIGHKMGSRQNTTSAPRA